MTLPHYSPAETVHWSRLGGWLPAVLTGDWSEHGFAGMRQADHQLRVLLQDDEPVAFAEFQWVVDECQLFSLAVLPRCRGLGLGTQLLRSVLEESARHGLRVCVLEVRESNGTARHLYERCGFVESGRRPRYYPPAQPGGERETAVLYCCELVSSSSA